MKKRRAIGVILLCLVLAGSVACNPFGGGEEEVSQQQVEVVRGDLVISISGSGNIEVANEMKLTFGSGGRIEKLYVEEGDEVSKGDVLAELDTDDLELALTQARVDLTRSQVGVTEAQVAVTRAEAAVTQGQIALETAEFNLEKARDLYAWADIKVAQADVDEAKRYMDEILWKLSKYDPGSEGEEVLQRAVIHAQLRLDAAEDRLEAMLSGTDPAEVAIKRLEVEQAQQSLELTRQSLELTRQSLQLAQLSPELAQQSLENTQKQFDEATITAPFNGVVASVYVDEGDVIPSPTVAPMAIIHLIDLTSMELKVEVDEIDMPGVKLGQEVTIEVDALPDFPFEGEVTSISPLAKEEAGVVIYEVKVSFNVPEGSGLKAGMSADANIVIAERSNVLLVPSRAITKDSEGNPVVKVIVGEQTQQRPVVIGLSDGLKTEIVEGLGEGEVVLLESRAK